MPHYEVVLNENRELTYILEADTPDDAIERLGELWSEDAIEPVHSETYFDVSDPREVSE